jgi:hypothetical protein
VDRVTQLAQGLTYRAFTAVCHVRRDGRRVSERLVARIPYPGAPVPDRHEDVLAAESQAALLSRLERLGLPLRLPRVLGTRPVACGTAIVETFVHGNLLLRLFEDEATRDEPRLGVVDWQRAVVGDPAYDLAIVTRGAAKPFQTRSGLPRLLDEYAARAPSPVTSAEVRFHEALLLAEGCAGAVREFGLDAPHAVQRREHLLRFIDRAA